MNWLCCIQYSLLRPLNSKYIIYTLHGIKVAYLLHNLSMYDILPSSVFEGKWHIWYTAHTYCNQNDISDTLHILTATKMTYLIHCTYLLPSKWHIWYTAHTYCHQNDISDTLHILTVTEMTYLIHCTYLLQPKWHIWYTAHTYCNQNDISDTLHILTASKTLN